MEGGGSGSGHCWTLVHLLMDASESSPTEAGYQPAAASGGRTKGRREGETAGNDRGNYTGELELRSLPGCSSYLSFTQQF